MGQQHQSDLYVKVVVLVINSMKINSMKYGFYLPLSALIVLGIITVMVNAQLVPPGLEMLEMLKTKFAQHFYLLLFVIILLEAIIYVGFYFPGQFFAVILVILAKPQWQDILYLTLAMVGAATLGSVINYCLGRQFKSTQTKASKPRLKSLLLAMLHINSLAFFMFAQGANRRGIKVVLLAGLLNLPYYCLLIVATSVLSEQVLQMAENTWLLASVIGIWLVIALSIDIKKHGLLDKKSTTS